MEINKKEQVRLIFVYLTIIAVILGVIGIFVIVENLSGKVVQERLSLNSYTKEEISKHNDERDCWISYKDKIYDITLFLQIYQDDSLKQDCGKAIENIDNIKEILKEYEIGVLG